MMTNHTKAVIAMSKAYANLTPAERKQVTEQAVARAKEYTLRTHKGMHTQGKPLYTLEKPSSVNVLSLVDTLRTHNLLKGC